MIEGILLIRLRSSSHLLQGRGQNGSGIMVLRGLLAIEPAQLLQARQLQGVQIRRVVLS